MLIVQYLSLVGRSILLQLTLRASYFKVFQSQRSLQASVRTRTKSPWTLLYKAQNDCQLTFDNLLTQGGASPLSINKVQVAPQAMELMGRISK